MKNEHIVWAYGETEDGSGQVLIIGLTHKGLEYLQAGEGQNKGTLYIDPPGKGFKNVVKVIVFNEVDKETLKKRFHEAGVPVSEAH